jgi:hypothetical protein
MGGGLPGLLRAIGAITVLVLALIGMLYVLELIPPHALQEWVTKTVLLFAISIAAATAIAALTRTGGRKR